MGLKPSQQRLVEAAIRESFGELRICEGLPADEIGVAIGAVMFDVAVEHRMMPSAIEDVISRAEQIANDRQDDSHDV